MPFTLAHPAAVLWCARWHPAGMPFSAFVIGSMSPDFEYFLRLRMLSFYSHSVLGILTFCIPTGLVIYGLFQEVIAPALYRNLPYYIADRLPEHTVHRGKGLRHLALVSLAIAVGAVTHILWDGFTHGNGPFVLRWSGLETDVLGLPLYKFLQHGSTLSGFGIMAIWLHRRQPRSIHGATGPDREYWPLIIALFLSAIGVLQQIRPGLAPANLAIQCIVGLFAALLIAGCWLRVKTWSTRA